MLLLKVSFLLGLRTCIIRLIMLTLKIYLDKAAKVQNKYGDKVTINIQGGRPGIELQESLFKFKAQDRGGGPRYAYLLTKLIQTNKVLVRKLPIIGMRDWLLIYEDTLVELSVKDAYDETYTEPPIQIPWPEVLSSPTH